jgi:hypothetical protein
MLQILNQSLRKEGPGFLFKGWTPAFVRLGPNTVLLFVFMEVRLLVHLSRVLKFDPSPTAAKGSVALLSFILND